MPSHNASAKQIVNGYAFDARNSAASCPPRASLCANQAPAQSQKKRKSWVPPSLRFDVKLTIEDCRRHAGADGAELGPGKLQSPLEADDVDSMDSHSSSSTSEEDSSDESQGSEGDVPPCVPCDPFVQVSEDDLEHNLRSEM